MGNGRNIWIDKVLESTNGMQKAMPDDALYNKIRNRIANYKVAARTIPLATVSAAAASLLILLAINFATLSGKDKKQATGNAAQELARYYDLESNNAYNL